MSEESVRRCYFCDDVLEEFQEDAHPECEAVALAADARICRVCGEPLPQDIGDHGLHPECVLDAWTVGPDPLLYPETTKRSDPSGSERFE